MLGAQRVKRGTTRPAASPPPATLLSPEVFARFSDLAYRKAGIVLKPGKESLVAGRIARRLRDLGLANATEYLGYLEADGIEGEEELVQFLDVISTNFTSFFREPDHFEYLAGAVAAWIDSGQRELSLWSAACSSGEEPYTIAMTLLEALGGRDVKFRILATDISTRVLAKAYAGVYEDQTLSGVPRSLRAKYFDRVDGTRGGKPRWKIKPVVRERIAFRRLNLSAPHFPMHGPFDAVLCRNVMIYFDGTLRERLINAISGLLKPDGVLLTGHSESIAGLCPELLMIRPSVYRRRDDAGWGPDDPGVRIVVASS